MLDSHYDFLTATSQNQIPFYFHDFLPALMMKKFLTKQNDLLKRAVTMRWADNVSNTSIYYI